MRLFEGTPFDRPPLCETCGALESECRCPPPSPTMIPPQRQTARLALERRKKGKLVTVVRGLPEQGNDLPALLTTLKTQCGAGGAIKEGELEIQGDQLDRVRAALTAIGYRVKA